MVKIYKKDSGGNLVEYPADQRYEIGILEGCEYGDLLVNDTMDVYFADVTGPIKYIAADSTGADTAKVTLRLGLIPSDGNTTLRKAAKKRDETAASYCSVSGFLVNAHGVGKTKVIPPIEIMLGETKYLAVAKRKDKNEYKIIEIETEFGEEPQYPEATNEEWEWVKKDDVWGTNPIEKLGSKSGVYWEKKWYNKTDNKNKDLPVGMVRLIGRYWLEGKVDSFKVKLKTTDTYNNAKVVVKVIKPGKLGNQYSKAKDVFDKVVNIDSLCIYYGGKNGIPPQFLKGHIAQESYTKDFGAQVGKGFVPGYRFEPYVTQKQFKIFNGEFSNNPFYITATTNVNPPNHKYVKIIPYFSGDTITVWQIVKEHSQLVEDGNTDPTRMYGVRTYSDTMNYNAYPTIRNKYREFFDKLKNTKILDDNGNKRLMTLSEKADSTNKRMIKYLRDEFPFKDKNNTKGMKNMIAQTRILASYGYFQVMYTTAIEKKWGYKVEQDSLPENLNTFNVQFPLVIKRYKGFLSNQNENNWIIGFETILKDEIYDEWNTKKKYPDEVLNKVENYLPKM